MEFTKVSQDYIDFFVSNIKKFNNDNRPSNKTSKKALEKLYDDILESDKYVSKKQKRSQIIKTGHKIISSKQVPLPSSLHETYFPIEIQKYIELESIYYLKYSCTISKRYIYIHIILTDEDDVKNVERYDKYVKYILMWFYIASLYSGRKYSKVVDFYLYMTDKTKELPTTNMTILSAINANSAYTTYGREKSEIVIYRKEEWFKVLIHEVFHTFCLDFATFNIHKFDMNLKKIFPIKYEISAYESYCDFWARIINSMFCSYHVLENKMDRENFLLYSDFCFQIERLFTLYQGVKVLKFMGLKYENLYKKDPVNQYMRDNFYKEDTHIFGYYILTMLLMNDYNGFISWCDNTNVSLLKFNAQGNTLHKFIEYIYALHDDKVLLSNIDNVFNILSKQIEEKDKKYSNLLKTMRMSIVEMK